MKLLSFATFSLLAFESVGWAEPALQSITDDAWLGAQGHHFSGRLTEVRPAPTEDDGRLKTFYRNTRQLLTSGEEGSVSWRVGGFTWTTRADDHGYWEISANQILVLAPGWHEITTTPASASNGHLLVVDPRNTFGIISDIDDTIMISDVPQKDKLLRNSLAVPPEKREPVAGMAELYQRLLKQNPAPESAPLVYVSGSPKQLTENLRLFLHANQFPRGVLQLKEVLGTQGESLSDQQAYKLKRIKTILAAFPQVRFALFGDDGEHDPEIYAQIQKEFPARVTDVWIRRVHPDPLRARYDGQMDTAELLHPKKSPAAAK